MRFRGAHAHNKKDFRGERMARVGEEKNIVWGSKRVGLKMEGFRGVEVDSPELVVKALPIDMSESCATTMAGPCEVKVLGQEKDENENEFPDEFAAITPLDVKEKVEMDGKSSVVSEGEVEVEAVSDSVGVERKGEEELTAVEVKRKGITVPTVSKSLTVPRRSARTAKMTVKKGRVVPLKETRRASQKMSVSRPLRRIVSWTDAEEKELCRAWRQHKVLYDTAKEEHGEHAARQVAWASIGTKLNVAGTLLVLVYISFVEILSFIMV